MRSDDQVTVFDDQVVDRDGWQVQLQGIPVLAIVKGDVDSGLSSRVEQPPLEGIFTDHARKDIICESCGDLRPGFAVIVGFVKIRLEIVKLVAVCGHVSRSRIVRRGFDNADKRPLRQFLRRHVLPTLAAVA